MSDSLTTFLFELANFLSLAAVLGWLFFKPVRTALANQRAKARAQEQQAAQTLSDAERLRADIDAQRHALAAELDEMRAKAREVARQEAAQLVAEARTQIERERASLKREAMQIDKVQTAKVAGLVASATHAALRRFLRQIEGPDLERSLISAACRELDAFSNNSIAPATVESAAPLDQAARQAIEASLGARASRRCFVSCQISAAALRIATAHGLIDASVAGLADFAKKSLAGEMQNLMREEGADE